MYLNSEPEKGLYWFSPDLCIVAFNKTMFSWTVCHVKQDIKVRVMMVMETTLEKVGRQRGKLVERVRAAYKANENFSML